MNKFFLFLIRLITGGALAAIITRIFQPDAQLVHIIGLGVSLVGLTYGLKCLKNRKSQN